VCLNHQVIARLSTVGWFVGSLQLQVLGSLNLQVSFAKEPCSCKCAVCLQPPTLMNFMVRKVDRNSVKHEHVSLYFDYVIDLKICNGVVADAVLFHNRCTY